MQTQKPKKGNWLCMTCGDFMPYGKTVKHFHERHPKERSVEFEILES